MTNHKSTDSSMEVFTRWNYAPLAWLSCDKYLKYNRNMIYFSIVYTRVQIISIDYVMHKTTGHYVSSKVYNLFGNITLVEDDNVV